MMFYASGTKDERQMALQRSAQGGEVSRFDCSRRATEGISAFESYRFPCPE